MAKKNLLSIVQDILNDLEGDEVNTIDDTQEAVQIANIVKSTYESIIISQDWVHTRRLTRLNKYGDSSLPTHMVVADNVKKVISIAYDKIKVNETNSNYIDIKYKEPDDFLRYINSRNESLTSVDSILDESGTKLNIINNKSPDYYTSFNDKVIVFDSYDKGVDDTLKTSKFQVLAYMLPEFVISDDFIPDMPAEMFPYLIEESKSRCSLKLRQTPDVKAERESQKQERFLGMNSWTVSGGIKFQKNGRR